MRAREGRARVSAHLRTCGRVRRCLLAERVSAHDNAKDNDHDDIAASDAQCSADNADKAGEEVRPRTKTTTSQGKLMVTNTAQRNHTRTV